MTSHVLATETDPEQIARLTVEVKHLQARVANAETALATAVERANTAHRENEATIERIAQWLRTEARTVSRNWAGAYRHLANQLDDPTAIPIRRTA